MIQGGSSCAAFAQTNKIDPYVLDTILAISTSQKSLFHYSISFSERDEVIYFLEGQ